MKESAAVPVELARGIHGEALSFERFGVMGQLRLDRCRARLVQADVKDDPAELLHAFADPSLNVTHIGSR